MDTNENRKGWKTTMTDKWIELTEEERKIAAEAYVASVEDDSITNPQTLAEHIAVRILSYAHTHQSAKLIKCRTEKRMLMSVIVDLKQQLATQSEGIAFLRQELRIS